MTLGFSLVWITVRHQVEIISAAYQNSSSQIPMLLTLALLYAVKTQLTGATVSVFMA